MFERFSPPIVIVGANASGKTLLSLIIAKEIGAEIISADSRQVYKHLTYGTSKPQGKWTKTPSGDVYIVELVPYHIVDFVDPLQTYSVAMYVSDVKNVISNTVRSLRIVICGGTGLYINALFNPLDPLPQKDPVLRNQLTEYAEKYGRDKLHEKLKQIDPVAANRIHPNNIQRVIRAIEVSILTSKPYSSLISNSFFEDRLVNAFSVFIVWDKALLYKRIKKRTVEVFDKWVDETESLLINGYPYDAPGLKSLGYPQVINFIESKITKNDAIEMIVRQSMLYAKRQNTWFRRYNHKMILEIKDEKEFDAQSIAKKIISEYESTYFGNKSKG